MGVPLTGRFEWVWVVLGGSVYVYYLVLKLPKGVPRLFALLPLFLLYIIVPWRGQSHAERSLMSFFFLWMGAFKLIMLAYDYGPGKDPWMMSSFSRFVAGMNISMHMNPDQLPSSESKGGEEISDKLSTTEGTNGNGLHSRKARYRGKQTEVAAEEKRKENRAKIGSGSRDGVGMPRFLEYLAYSLDWKIVLLRCVFYLVFIGFWLQLYMTQAHMSPLILYLTYTILLYVGVLLTVELPAAIAASFFQVELPAQFNMPFLATSIADFWGRRWNLLVNNLLRVSVYFPILEAFGGRSGKRPSFLVKGLAILASFTVSGIMHEIIFFYMSQKAPTFEYTMFFVLNGVGSILEYWLKRKMYYNPSNLVGWLVTFCFIFFTASWLFFPPMVKSGIDRHAIDDMNTFVLWIRDLILDSLSWITGWPFASSMIQKFEFQWATA